MIAAQIRGWTRTDFEDAFSGIKEIGTDAYNNPGIALLIAFSVFSIYILVTQTRRPRNRKRLRALIGPNYSEDKSFIGVRNSISVDDKSGRFAIISGGQEFLCEANEILSAEFTPSTKGSLATLAIEMASEAHPRFEMSVAFREDKLREIHRLLKVLQKQDPQPHLEQQAALLQKQDPQPHLEQQAALITENDRLFHAVERLNCSIVTLTEVAKTISDEFQQYRIDKASRQSGANTRGRNNDVGKE